MSLTFALINLILYYHKENKNTIEHSNTILKRIEFFVKYYYFK